MDIFVAVALVALRTLPVKIALDCVQLKAIISSWWIQPNWKILLKLDHLPRVGGENKKIVETTNQTISWLDVFEDRFLVSTGILFPQNASEKKRPGLIHRCCTPPKPRHFPAVSSSKDSWKAISYPIFHLVKGYTWLGRYPIFPWPENFKLLSWTSFLEVFVIAKVYPKTSVPKKVASH